MTSQQLFSAIGQIDDRFITAAAPRTAPRRLWLRWCAAAACLCLAVAAGITLWQSGIFTPAEPVPTPDAHGGDDNHDYSYAYLSKLYSISGELIDWLEQQGIDFDTWSEERIEEIKNTKYDVASPADTPFLLDAIETFDIPREVIEAFNDERPEEYSFTAEELDALYSGDPAAVTRVFASPYAVVAGDRAFAPRFYLNATQEELDAYGITREMIAPKLSLLRRDRVIEDAYPINQLTDVEYGLPYLRKLYSLAAVEELCPGDPYSWAEQQNLQYINEKYPFATSDTLPTLLLAIEHFGISKEEFERVNSQRIAYYSQRNEPYFVTHSCFTEEEINALYSDDPAELLRVFASEYAILSGGKAYAPAFYLNATQAELNACGITRETVEQKRELLRTDGII